MDSKVTVFMPVRNCERFLEESIRSILEQTYIDITFLIIDDASEDDSVKIIQSFNDSRIIFIENKHKSSLPRLRNQGMKLAGGEYIALMDADDICCPTRIKKQIQLMDANPEIGVCGTYIDSFGESEKFGANYPTKPELIKVAMIFSCSMSHATCMFRREMLLQNGLWYDETLDDYGEDTNFLLRCSFDIPVANIPEPLYSWRIRSDSSSGKGREDQKRRHNVYRNYCKVALDHAGVEYEDNELDFHVSIPLGTYKCDISFIEKAHRWFFKLLRANEKNKKYDEDAFSFVLGKYFINFIDLYRKNYPADMRNIWKFMFSPYIRSAWSFEDLTRLIFKK